MLDVMNGWNRSRWIMGLMVMSAAMQGCFFETKADPKENDWFEEADSMALNSGARQCSEFERTSYRGVRMRYDDMRCVTNDDFYWRNRCNASECHEVPVFVHYMINKDIGEDATVYIEAFDNNRFFGFPAATTQVSHFRTDRVGEYEQTTIYLGPGQYYLRAYIGRSDQVSKPYEYGDLELVAGEATGVYGAVSAPEVIEVLPAREERWAKPVHIYLDKLFKSPGSDRTKANLRVLLEVDPQATISENGFVRVRIYEHQDLAQEPTAEATALAANLLVEGRKGKMDVVLTDAPEGEFVVFAFLDANFNGFYDQGELAQVLRDDLGKLRLVKLQAKRTETVTLKMVLNPELPH